MRIGIRNSIFPLRDAWDKFLIHGVATPAIIGIAGTTAFITGGFPLLIIAGGASLLSVIRNEYRDLASTLAKSKDIHQLPSDHPVTILTEKLARKAGLKSIPRCYSIGIAPNGAPYAAAAGTSESGIIMVSDLIHQRISPKELEAVIAHEVIHIGRSDTKTRLRQTAIAMLTQMSHYFNVVSVPLALIGLGTIPTLGTFALALGGIISCKIIMAATSRAFERRADRGAITLTKNPWALSSALERIVELHNVNIFRRMMTPNRGLFSYIGRRLFATHPHMNYRQSRLSAMAKRFLKQEPKLEKLKNETLKEITEFEHRAIHMDLSSMFDTILKDLPRRVMNAFRKPAVSNIVPASSQDDVSIEQSVYQPEIRRTPHDRLQMVSRSTPNFNSISRRPPQTCHHNNLPLLATNDAVIGHHLV